ncbi:glycosyl transferase family 2, partial [Pseudomonas sp. MWU13-2860]
MSRISIIIPMYNEARHIGRTLLAAQKAAHAANVECEL